MLCNANRRLRVLSQQVVSSAGQSPVAGGAEFTVRGAVAPGFEKVLAAFSDNFARGLELGAQLCIYHNNGCIVDLHGRTFGESAPGGQVVDHQGQKPMESLEGYNADSIQQVFSSTKNLTALSIAMAVDQGLLAYDAPVAKYWSAFGNNGKGDIKVEDVLRHDSGLSQFSKMATKDDIETAGTGADSKMSKLIEDSPPVWWTHPLRNDAPDQQRFRRGYHGITRGFILSQLLQRVDPKGRSVGQFIRDEVAVPLGLSDNLFIGVPENARPHIANMAQTIPKEVVEQQKKMLGDTGPVLGDGRPWSKKDPEDGHFIADIMMRHISTNYEAVMRMMSADMGVQNSKWSRAIESPSANGHTNARCLAKIAAVLAAGGSMDGVTLLSKDTFAKAHGNVTQKFDDVLLVEERFSAGGFAEFPMDKNIEAAAMFAGVNFSGLTGSFFGWGGAGGSVFIWSPDHKVGFSYTMTGMAEYVVGGPRTRRILSALMESLSELNRH